jgi:hypothetical protein
MSNSDSRMANQMRCAAACAFAMAICVALGFSALAADEPVAVQASKGELMKMDEPMAGEMKKKGMKKRDVEEAAEKKHRQMRDALEKEQQSMPQSPAQR